MIKRLDALIQKERETTLEVIKHIIEFDRRKLYLGIGYGSLYKYCTLHLGYSEPAAMRRIKTARCVREFPEIYLMLEKNELNLTGICKLTAVLNKENSDELLKKARYKSSRQIDEIVTRYNPSKDIRDRVSLIMVSANTGNENKPDKMNPEDSSTPEPPHNPEDSMQQNCVKFTFGADGKKLTTCSNSSQQTEVLQKKYKLEFTVEPECMKKIEEAKGILSKKYPSGVLLGTLLEESLDAYLDKHCPERKKKRSEKRKAKLEAKKDGRQYKTPRPGRMDADQSKHSRHIPQAVQDQVLTRDGGRCTYEGPDGVRCNSTWNLHIDHIMPYAKGGDHSIHNLRLLCAKHNHLEAERVYGREYIENQICKARQMIE